MDFLRTVIAWLLDPAHWAGSGGIPTRIGEHLLLLGGPLVIAILVALPIGLYIGHTGRGALLAVNLSNIGRALPSLGILGIFLPITAGLGLGFGVPPTVIALFALAVPPIVTNTFTGIREVDAELIEAGRGMGMRESELLLQVELPLAMPIVLAGLRTSAVQVVATATLGAVLGTGGLGRYIIDGIAQQDDPQLFVGAVIVALLAIATELAFAALQRAAISPGMRRSEQSPAGLDVDASRPAL
ncbi:MAG: ABC transporter permease [Chloroflexota bacterium]|nr:ABC transporter permease [Chloroflexota bacterium]